MNRRLPNINKSKRVLFVCEGAEETDYINRLKTCGVWDKAYSVKVKNAGNIDNISAVYQNEYQNNNYDIVIIFCDTELYPYEQFNRLQKNLEKFLGNKHYKKILLFANPCTMQVILSHFGKVYLKTNNKAINAKDIKELTGVKDYEATEHQRISIMNKINKDNYIVMKNNLANISSVSKDVPSTNVLTIFEHLETADLKWMNKINEALIK